MTQPALGTISAPKGLPNREDRCEESDKRSDDHRKGIAQYKTCRAVRVLFSTHNGQKTIWS